MAVIKPANCLQASCDTNFLPSCLVMPKDRDLWSEFVKTRRRNFEQFKLILTMFKRKYKRKVKFLAMRCLAGLAARNYVFSRNIYNKCRISEIERSVSKKV